jgi:hypothetical protein
LLAARYGFRRITGVELSSDLCKTALQNLEIYGRQKPLSGEISVLCCDVVDYAIREDDTIFFMFTVSPSRVWKVLQKPRGRAAGLLPTGQVPLATVGSHLAGIPISYRTPPAAMGIQRLIALILQTGLRV